MRHLVVLGCVLAANIAAAEGFDGVYRQAANADCTLVGVDGGAIEIRDGAFYGVGSTCQMNDPVNVVDMDAVLYRMQCAGEDTRWSERAMILHKAERDGIIMIWNGYAFVYDRCPAAKD